MEVTIKTNDIMTAEQQTAVLKLKADCNTFYEQINDRIDNICNDMGFNGGFRNASKLSHIADRLDLFIKELNEF